MPELPEVEKVRQVLSGKEIINQKILRVEIFIPQLIKEIEKKEFTNLLENQTIKEIKRKGKWLFFILDNHVMISHLGMTGKYFLEENLISLEQKKSIVLIFQLDNGKKLIYCDSRRFGNFRLQRLEEYKELTPYKNIGSDLLNEEINVKELFHAYNKRRVPVKVALLEQNIISGIGNIYACEILFEAKIHPLRKTNELTYEEIEKIISWTKIILKKSLELGGTSAFDFINPLAEKGKYQNFLNVYGKENKACPVCKNQIKRIEKETNNRSTYFCPQCQE